jgi:xanthine/CO dehydrogenase XdhC/CoxF family maturation factor
VILKRRVGKTFALPSTSLRVAAGAPRFSRVPLSPETSYHLMGNCCGGTATVPSEPALAQLPAPAPHVSQRTTPTVQSRHNMEMTPVSSPQLPRTRSRTTSKPESTHHSRTSSLELNPRSRTKSAPQRSQSSKSLSTRNPRTRAEMLSARKRSSRSDSRPTSPGKSLG